MRPIYSTSSLSTPQEPRVESTNVSSKPKATVISPLLSPLVAQYQDILQQCKRTSFAPTAPAESNKIVHSSPYITHRESKQISSLFSIKRQPAQPSDTTYQKAIQESEGYSTIQKIFFPNKIVQLDGVNRNNVSFIVEKREEYRKGIPLQQEVTFSAQQAQKPTEETSEEDLYSRPKPSTAALGAIPKKREALQGASQTSPKRDSSNLIISHNSRCLTYYEVPENMKATPIACGGFKSFCAVDYKGTRIPLHYEKRPEKQLVITGWEEKKRCMPAFSQNLFDMVERGTPGAKLIAIPQLIPKITEDSLSYISSYMGDEDLTSRMQKDKINPDKIQSQKKRNQSFMRDVYMANEALRFSGYENIDIKASNCIIVPDESGTERAVTIDIDDLPVSRITRRKPLTDVSLYKQMLKIKSLVQENNMEESVYMDIYQHILMIKLYISLQETFRGSFSLKELSKAKTFEENPKYSFVTTKLPIEYLVALNKYYINTRNTQGERRINTMLNYYTKAQDSLKVRLEIIENFTPEDINIITYHLEHLLALDRKDRNGTKTILKENCVQTIPEQLTPKHSILDAVQNESLTEDAIQSLAKELYNLFEVTKGPKEVVMVELEFLAKFLVNPESAIADLSIESGIPVKDSILVIRNLIENITKKLFSMHEYKDPIAMPALYGMIPIVNAQEEETIQQLHTSTTKEKSLDELLVMLEL